MLTGKVFAGDFFLATRLLAGETQANATVIATSEAEKNGYDGTNPNNTITLAYASSTSGTQTETVQATVRVQAPLYFSSLVIDEVYIAAFSAAGTEQLGEQCVLALHPTASGAVTFTGNTNANVGCGVTSNSSAATDALIVSGSAILSADPVQAVGGIDVNGSATVNSSYPLMPLSPVVPDPRSLSR